MFLKKKKQLGIQLNQMIWAIQYGSTVVQSEHMILESSDFFFDSKLVFRNLANSRFYLGPKFS